MRFVKPRVLQVQAALAASANPAAVETLERILYELRDEDRRGVASMILAVFEGNADAAEYELRRAMNDDPPWVAKIFTSGEKHAGFPEMLVLHLIDVREAHKKGEPCPA